MPGPPLPTLQVQTADRPLHDTDNSNSQPTSLVARSPLHDTHDSHFSLSYPSAQMISHQARNVSVFGENL
jgi:hypothetical protein